jgi:hypothetical protein
MFIKRRPSAVTAYCGLTPGPVKILPPVGNRVAKSATGVPASTVCPSVLKELNVSVESQMVFSKTGVQAARTSPGNPRALPDYFCRAIESLIRSCMVRTS